MAITEAVVAEAAKEGAKVIAKKVVKEVAKNAAKNAVKNVAKKAVKGALKEKPKKVPLYTEDEQAELKSLYGKRSYYRKKLEELAENLKDNETRTLQEIRKNISDNVAYDLKNKGYFDPDKKLDYSNKDFREWMAANGDESLMQQVMDDYNSLATDESRISDEADDGTQKKMNEYADKARKAEEEIAKIQKKARDRRNMKIAKDLAKRNRLENAESLAEAFDEGDLLISKLSNPEREAVNFVKDKFASAMINNIDFKGLPEDETMAAKHGIYKAVMDNPISGIRAGINEAVSLTIKSKYGNEAGDIASKLIDLATGKGSGKSVGLELFKGVINKTGLNPELMNERAEELISMGESTIGEEAMKRLGRDVIVDIGKAIIKSGGQIEIAIPMAIKSILFDAGKAGAKAIMK